VKKMFEPGDRVRRVGDSYNQVKKGKVYTVKDVLGINSITLKEVEKGSYSFKADMFELAEEAMKLKKGDLVRVTIEGTVGVVTPDGAWVGNANGSNSRYFKNENMEKLKEPLPTEFGSVVRTSDNRLWLRCDDGKWHTDQASWSTPQWFETRDYDVLRVGLGLEGM
jgi:hypothetical protein